MLIPFQKSNQRHYYIRIYIYYISYIEADALLVSLILLYFF
jgi:hypothetical protein